MALSSDSEVVISTKLTVKDAAKLTEFNKLPDGEYSFRIRKGNNWIGTRKGEKALFADPNADGFYFRFKSAGDGLFTIALNNSYVYTGWQGNVKHHDHDKVQKDTKFDVRVSEIAKGYRLCTIKGEADGKHWYLEKSKLRHDDEKKVNVFLLIGDTVEQ